ncbi:probable serine/threonine-protein kinase MARK-B isoform X2 [Microplitis demolitor]|uniref:probable serine/threonine-protein kinase MARK-B isoform X2 n=1 Tax=Microplitis demolitor TaxID=69319 RepID=UPI0004CD3E57|nr:probable serine/threonine-protein kinase MARK-B isoform X2 [Microplitis demolitor]
MTNNIEGEAIRQELSSPQSRMENGLGYEPMDASEPEAGDAGEVQEISPDSDPLSVDPSAIDNDNDNDTDTFSMNIDVPFVENDNNIENISNALTMSPLIDDVSAEVHLNQSMSLASSNLEYTSVSEYRELDNPRVECLGVRYPEISSADRNRTADQRSSSSSSSDSSSSSSSSSFPNEVQRVPEVNPSQSNESNTRTSESWRSYNDEIDFTTLIPAYGTPVSPKSIKRAGPYILGPLIGTSPVRSIVQCLARKAGTDKYYTIKILTLKDDNEEETQDDRQGKMLLHAEYSLLSLLQNQEGVVHHHGFFKDSALEEKTVAKTRIYTGRIVRRLCLVLDCLTSHDFNPRNEELLNLQHHVIREKKLSEKESLLIFTDTVRIVAELHKRNIVHRDLKLGNLVLNRKTRKVTITNFCLGKHLASENDLLKDQRGSPAYISPDVLCGKPYLGKPSDMWALGVVLFTMLYGQFPFYDSTPTQLFVKIKAANYQIPMDNRVSEKTINLIRDLLVLQPSRRLTAVQVLECLSIIIYTFKIPASIGEEEQVVPDITDMKDDPVEKKTESAEKSKLRSSNDLFKQINFREQMMMLMNQSQSPLVPRGRSYGQIPVHRVNSDPRELTPAELEMYRHLIPNDNQRQHSHSSSRRDNVMRARAATRYRPSSHPPRQAALSQSQTQAPTPTQNPVSAPQNPANQNPANQPADNPPALNNTSNPNRSLNWWYPQLSTSLNPNLPPRSSTTSTPETNTNSGSTARSSPLVLGVPVGVGLQASRDPMSARYDHARMSMAIRASLMNRNQRNASEQTRTISSATSNRSVPSGGDESRSHSHSRFREAIVNQIVSIRARLQQDRINNIERQIESVRNGLMGNPRSNSVGNNTSSSRYSVARRNLLAQSRHLPYMTNLRYLSTIRNVSNDISRTRATDTSDINLDTVIHNNINHNSVNEMRNSVSRNGNSDNRDNRFSVSNFADALQQIANRLGQSLQQTHEFSEITRDSRLTQHDSSESLNARDQNN